MNEQLLLRTKEVKHLADTVLSFLRAPEQHGGAQKQARWQAWRAEYHREKLALSELIDRLQRIEAEFGAASRAAAAAAQQQDQQQDQARAPEQADSLQHVRSASLETLNGSLKASNFSLQVLLKSYLQSIQDAEVRFNQAPPPTDGIATLPQAVQLHAPALATLKPQPLPPPPEPQLQYQPQQPPPPPSPQPKRVTGGNLGATLSLMLSSAARQPRAPAQRAASPNALPSPPPADSSGLLSLSSIADDADAGADAGVGVCTGASAGSGVGAGAGCAPGLDLDLDLQDDFAELERDAVGAGAETGVQVAAVAETMVEAEEAGAREDSHSQGAPSASPPVAHEPAPPPAPAHEPAPAPALRSRKAKPARVSHHVAAHKAAAGAQHARNVSDGEAAFPVNLTAAAPEGVPSGAQGGDRERDWDGVLQNMLRLHERDARKCI
jgi:hypothetical protein